MQGLREAVIVAVAVVASAVPHEAMSEPPVPIEHKWCVRADGQPGSYAECEGPAACSGTFLTISEAVAAARAAHDPDLTDPPAHMICVDTPDIHFESVVIDNGDGALGRYLGVQFTSLSGANWCDDGVGSAAAGFEVLGSGEGEEAVEILKLRTDETVCSRTRPIFRANSIDLGATRLVALGGREPVLTSASTSPEEHSVGILRSVIEGHMGAALEAGSTLFVVESVIAGSTSTGVPLVSMSASSSLGASNTASLEVEGSVLVGNAVEAAPLLLSAEGVDLAGTVLHGNVVAGGDLVSVGPASPAFRVKSILTQVEFSENRLLALGATLSAAPSVHSADDPDTQPDLPCGIRALQGVPVSARVTASSFGVSGTSALLRFTEPGSDATSLRVYRSYFVDNEVGPAGAVLDLGSSHLDTSVYVVHSLFGPSFGPLIRGGDGLGLCRLASVRNIYLGSPALALGSCWGRLEATMDRVEGSAGGWEAALPSLPVSVVGPTLEGLPKDPFLELALVDELEACARYRAHCPNVDVGCSSGTGWCPQGAGRGYLFSEEARTELAVPYPWQGTILAGGGSSAFDTPGPAGWDCAGDQPLPTDNPEKADADGYTDLVDCNNGDASVTPQLPEWNGVTSPWCEPQSDGCYECPQESCWPPGDGDCPELPSDDDDSGDDDQSGHDDAADDDSAGGDDEGLTGGTCPDPENCVPGGCLGCGVPLVPTRGTLLLPLALVGGLGVQRRRRAG